MNIDFRISVDFWQHPKTKKLIRRTGLEGVRSLQILWAWTACNRSSGVLSDMDEEDIELAADWQGDIGTFIAALKEMHWIDETPEGYVLHEWLEHNPWVADDENRSNKARLSKLQQVNPAAYDKCVNEGKTGLTKAEYETLKAYCADDERISSNRTATAQRPHSDRKINAERNASETLAPSPSPVKLNTPLSSNEDIPPQGEVSSKGKRKETITSVLDEQPQELIPALTEFVNHRKSIKKPLTAHALRLNIKDLQRLAPGDIQKQKELIEYAIKKGWQGFYLPNEEQQYANAAHVPRAANFSQQLRLEQDMQAKALLAASQRRNENAQLIGDGRTDNEAELALPPEWRAF